MICVEQLLIVEDDKALNWGLCEALKVDKRRIISFQDLKTAMEQLLCDRVSLVLLDINLPDGSGLNLLREIKERTPDIPVILLTANDKDMDIVDGLEQGADDYITKPFNPLELTARVKSVLRRYTQLGAIAEKKNHIFRIGGLVVDDDGKEVTVEGEPVKLTPIEYRILLLLVKNPGKVFSIGQIYESIWNEDAISGDNTVAVHIRHIREKIEINPKEPRYLKVVWGVGYKIDRE